MRVAHFRVKERRLDYHAIINFELLVLIWLQSSSVLPVTIEVDERRVVVVLLNHLLDRGSILSHVKGRAVFRLGATCSSFQAW